MSKDKPLEEFELLGSQISPDILRETLYHDGSFPEPKNMKTTDFVIYKDKGIDTDGEVIYNSFEEPIFETPEEVYQYVTTHECEFYPNKCKERWRWKCPKCGIAAYECGGNCAIVKLNHYETKKGNSYFWFCNKCTEEYWDKKFNET